MRNTTIQTAPPEIEPLILEIRGHKVILDADLARIYGVQTKALNQAVKRNHARFPGDFVFKLSVEEIRELNRSQIVTGSQKHRDPRSAPYAFTERGAIMGANVLNGQRAVDMSVFVVRAFVKMRSAFGDSRELARKLAPLEQELTCGMLCRTLRSSASRARPLRRVTRTRGLSSGITSAFTTSNARWRTRPPCRFTTRAAWQIQP